jgi:outer membrane biosynthesis protein TonB
MGFEGLNARRVLYISVAISLAAHVLLFVLLAYLPEEEAKPPTPYVVSIVEPEAEPPPAEEPPPVEEPPLPEELPLEEILPPEEEILPLEEEAEEIIIVKKPKLEELPEVMEGEDDETLIPSEKKRDRKPMETGKEEIQEDASPGHEGEIGISKLLDRQVIEEFAKLESSEEPGNDITFDAEAFKYASYKKMLEDKLQWAFATNPIPAYVPEGAQVWYVMVIRKDGTLDGIKILKSSRYEVFDKHVIKLLREQAPYWPLPEGWNKNEYNQLGVVTITNKNPFFIIVQ